ncbi:MAG: hypothetical protein JWP07_4014 [Pseudonocardiales bacterium]|nr:hypothetical protein [Pseudonocardiales bacterium]
MGIDLADDPPCLLVWSVGKFASGQLDRQSHRLLPYAD